MKKMLLGCLGAALLLVSCSDDDTSGTTITNPPLVTTTQKIFRDGVLAEIYNSEYSNGRITKMKWLTPDNVQTGYTELAYTGNGLLASTTNYNGTIIYSKSIYDYDSQQRMTKIDFVSDAEGITYETNFTHNSNNTITAVRTGFFESSKTFYLNSDGNVYKETGGQTIEITYNGTTATTLSINGVATIDYEYDTEHNPALINMNMGAGSFKANNILREYGIYDSVATASDKYITKEITSGYTWRHVYTFNSSGLPTKKQSYYNDVLRSEMEYFYN